MAAYSPLAFAVAQASTASYGILYIETSNNGSATRYLTELADLGDEIIDVLRYDDRAFVTDFTLPQADAILSKITAEYDDRSCLGYAAVYIRPNGHIARTWAGGQDSEHMIQAIISHHASL